MVDLTSELERDYFGGQIGQLESLLLFRMEFSLQFKGGCSYTAPQNLGVQLHRLSGSNPTELMYNLIALRPYAGRQPPLFS